MNERLSPGIEGKAPLEERMTAAEYRALTAGAKPKSHGSKRGSAGSSVGTCAVCGGHVGRHDPAQFETPDPYRPETRWVRHLNCSGEGER